MQTNHYQESILRILRQSSFQNKDVKVIIDNVPCGLWLWEEISRTHVRFDRAELLDFLGASEEMLDYLENLPTLDTCWKFINPNRLREALA